MVVALLGAASRGQLPGAWREQRQRPWPTAGSPVWGGAGRPEFYLEAPGAWRCKSSAPRCSCFWTQRRLRGLAPTSRALSLVHWFHTHTHRHATHVPDLLAQGQNDIYLWHEGSPFHAWSYCRMHKPACIMYCITNKSGPLPKWVYFGQPRLNRLVRAKCTRMGSWGRQLWSVPVAAATTVSSLTLFLSRPT